MSQDVALPFSCCEFLGASGALASLVDQVGSCWFTSSVSAYRDFSTVGQDESTPLIELEDPTVEEVRGDTYGGMKALCEQVAQSVFGDQTIIVRPTLIIGPLDKTDRFTYWPVRLARGGEAMAPGHADDPVQTIDVRDLADWAIRMAETGHHGGLQCNRPPSTHERWRPARSGRLERGKHCQSDLGGCRFSESKQVRAWSDMPVWIPPAGEYNGFATFSNQAALDCGRCPNLPAIPWHGSEPCQPNDRQY